MGPGGLRVGIVVDRGQKKAHGAAEAGEARRESVLRVSVLRGGACVSQVDEEGHEGWARSVRSLEFGAILRNELQMPISHNLA